MKNPLGFALLGCLYTLACGGAPHDASSSNSGGGTGGSASGSGGSAGTSSSSCALDFVLPPREFPNDRYDSTPPILEIGADGAKLWFVAGHSLQSMPLGGGTVENTGIPADKIWVREHDVVVASGVEMSLYRKSDGVLQPLPGRTDLVDAGQFVGNTLVLATGDMVLPEGSSEYEWVTHFSAYDLEQSVETELFTLPCTLSTSREFAVLDGMIYAVGGREDDWEKLYKAPLAAGATPVEIHLPASMKRIMMLDARNGELLFLGVPDGQETTTGFSNWYAYRMTTSGEVVATFPDVEYAIGGAHAVRSNGGVILDVGSSLRWLADGATEIVPFGPTSAECEEYTFHGLTAAGGYAFHNVYRGRETGIARIAIPQ